MSLKREKNKLNFQNWHKQLPVLYIVYTDFEALTIKTEGPELNPRKSNTQNIQHHRLAAAATRSTIVMVEHNNLWYTEDLT